MEFTVQSTTELEKELENNGYNSSQIDAIVSMFEEEFDGSEQTITVSPPN